MAQRPAFERLRSASDTRIYDWLTSHPQLQDQGICQIIKKIQHQFTP